MYWDTEYVWDFTLTLRERGLLIGIHGCLHHPPYPWVPAFAGMTEESAGMVVELRE